MDKRSSLLRHGGKRDLYQWRQIGARNVIYNLSIDDLAENVERVRAHSVLTSFTPKSDFALSLQVW